MDLTVEYADIRDESIPTRTNTFARFKKYTFYIGDYGPFVERVPLDQAGDNTEINRRVEVLRAQLRSLPT